MSSNLSSVQSSLDDFGPVEAGDFDFTPLFEDTLLSLIPSLILLSLLPFRLYTLNNRTRKVTGGSLHSSKLVSRCPRALHFKTSLDTNPIQLFLVVFSCMQTVLLILYTINNTLRTRATLAAASFGLVDSLGLCILSHSEHIHSVRPSAIINVYLLLTLPFDAARSRTLWLDGATKSTAAVFTSTVAVKLMILITEAIEKRSILLERYRYSSPEATSGIYSRSFFWWLNNLMTTGFSRIIKNEDLYPIDDDMASSFLQKNAQKTWEAAGKTKSRALVWSTIKASRQALAYGIFPRLCLVGFRYAQPFLLSRTVNFAGNPEESVRLYLPCARWGSGGLLVADNFDRTQLDGPLLLLLGSSSLVLPSQLGAITIWHTGL